MAQDAARAQSRTEQRDTATQANTGESGPRSEQITLDADAKEARRMLHLANGQTVRVVSRWNADHWEYRNKAGWQVLAPGQVGRAVLERDVLREWTARRDQADLKQVAERVELARWALAAGLVTEGLAQIDVVLAREPDCADALALLRPHGLVNVPALSGPETQLAAQKETLYRWAAARPISGREMAVMELGRLARDAALEEELSRELRSPIVTRRSFGALALRRLFPGRGIKPLLSRAVLDPSEDVRRLSALALHAAGEPGVIVPVVRALESGSSGVRANAAEALGNMEYTAAVEPLIGRLAVASAAQSGSGGRIPHSYIFVGNQIAYVQDFDVQVAQYAAIAKPIVNTLVEGDVLDAAVIGVQEVMYEVEIAMIGKSLQKLTGAQKGKSAKEWLKWWDENGSSWKSSDLSKKGVPTGEQTKG
jgi:hypothetical protein